MTTYDYDDLEQLAEEVLGEMEKDAAYTPTAKDLKAAKDAMSFGQKARSTARNLVGRHAVKLHRHRAKAWKGAKEMLGEARKGEMDGKKLSVGERLRHAGGAAKKMAPELATGAAVAGVAAHKAKQASAFETLATQRAEELLAASEAESATPYDVLADVVEERAIEILEANGYELSDE